MCFSCYRNVVGFASSSTSGHKYALGPHPWKRGALSASCSRMHQVWYDVFCVCECEAPHVCHLSCGPPPRMGSPAAGRSTCHLGFIFCCCLCGTAIDLTRQLTSLHSRRRSNSRAFLGVQFGSRSLAGCRSTSVHLRMRGALIVCAIFVLMFEEAFVYFEFVWASRCRHHNYSPCHVYLSLLSREGTSVWRQTRVCGLDGICCRPHLESLGHLT